ncbi:MAG: arginine N-succinyltransferase [Myxococcales bacterium]|nr:arginine N-succinyltransferase [Myxococcales bacterium]
MYLLRQATSSDLEALVRLAKLLDTINLPADPDAMDRLLAESHEAFEGASQPDQAMFFVLEDPKGEVCGCSNIIAHHGSPEAPHTYFDVIEEDRYSRDLERLFSHLVLRLGTSFHPRTEIGGLILEPSHRGKGMASLLSRARFQYIAAYRERFCERILAELLPPFDDDGSSPLWKALGRRFTGLDYREADRLSINQKEFIEDLFPRGDIYVSLFDEETHRVIGTVGDETKGVEVMLRREGFRYQRRIDPFDGGPHYGAPTDRVRSVRLTRSCRAIARASGGRSALVAALEPFRSVRSQVELTGLQVCVPPDALARLQASEGQDLLVTPLEENIS